MSYILEALRKSQQERELTKVPAAALDDLPGAVAPGGSSRWVVATMLMAAVAVAISLYAVLGSRLVSVSERENMSNRPDVETSRLSGGDHPGSALEQALQPPSALASTRSDLSSAPERREVTDGVSSDRLPVTPVAAAVPVTPSVAATQPPVAAPAAMAAPAAGAATSRVAPVTPSDVVTVDTNGTPKTDLATESPPFPRVERDLPESRTPGANVLPLDPPEWQDGGDTVATQQTTSGALEDGASGSFRREAELLRDRLLNLERALKEEEQLPVPKRESHEVKKAPSGESRLTVAKAAQQPGGQPAGDRIPSVTELPAHVLQSLPPRNILVHVYNERPENRFIILNSQRHKQGDTTKDGFVIEEVQPDGVVLRFRGQRFFNPR